MSNGKNFTATIVVQLSGEMGNNLGKIAHALFSKWSLEEQYGVRGDIWLRHQGEAKNRKWKVARASMRECFDFSRHMDFEQGNTDDFLSVEDSGQRNNNLTNFVKGIFEDKRLSSGNNARPSGIMSGTDTTISVPFLYSHDMITYGFDLDRFYDRIRDYFRFDYNKLSCCDVRPYPDESVFHLRNFRQEFNRNKNGLGYQELSPDQVAKNLFGHLKREETVVIEKRYADVDDKEVRSYVEALEKRGLTVRVLLNWQAPLHKYVRPGDNVFSLIRLKQEALRAKRMGFEELGPVQAAAELFGHLEPGNKVAIVSRYADDPDVRLYVDALEKRGLIVRVISGSGLQDFCFLLSAEKEIVGVSISTFLFYAGILGNAKRVRVYSIDSPEKRRSGRFKDIFEHYDFEHPELKRRVVFSLHKPDPVLDPDW